MDDKQLIKWNRTGQGSGNCHTYLYFRLLRRLHTAAVIVGLRGFGWEHSGRSTRCILGQNNFSYRTVHRLSCKHKLLFNVNKTCRCHHHHRHHHRHHHHNMYLFWNGENRHKIGQVLMTAARETHVSALCDDPCCSILIWRNPYHTATSSTVNKQLPIIIAPTEAS
jgi:hypothetical protein